MQDNNTWVQTFSGGRFMPLWPRVEDIEIRDIAHALAHNCRFGGHCPEFYSVAQHSMIVAEILKQQGRSTRNCILWGLLHDAAEAYLPDVCRPIKASVHVTLDNGRMVTFSQLEELILSFIADRFGLPRLMKPEIKVADNIALATEARLFWPDKYKSWNLAESEDKFIYILPASPMVAERMFLGVLEEWI